jgi:hypothetical protein
VDPDEDQNMESTRIASSHLGEQFSDMNKLMYLADRTTHRVVTLVTNDSPTFSNAMATSYLCILSRASK